MLNWDLHFKRRWTFAVLSAFGMGMSMPSASAEILCDNLGKRQPLQRSATFVFPGSECPKGYEKVSRLRMQDRILPRGFGIVAKPLPKLNDEGFFSKEPEKTEHPQAVVSVQGPPQVIIQNAESEQTPTPPSTTAAEVREALETDDGGFFSDLLDSLGFTSAGLSSGVAPISGGVLASSGPRGRDGAPGIDGLNGENGRDGSNGMPGPVGATGSAGERGISGATGATGPQGDAGPQGPTGAQGFPGLPGVQGPAGADGQDGIAGATGLDGARGEKGDSGSTGLFRSRR